MKAFLYSAQVAPKKANIIAKMVRGKTVEDAVTLLENTHKKAARFFEKLIKSAAANAQKNEGQDISQLKVSQVFVNQGTSLRRGMPMARGRQRPYRKFLSHLTVALGIVSHEEPAKELPKKTKKTKPSAQ